MFIGVRQHGQPLFGPRSPMVGTHTNEHTAVIEVFGYLGVVNPADHRVVVAEVTRHVSRNVGVDDVAQVGDSLHRDPDEVPNGAPAVGAEQIGTPHPVLLVGGAV